ncbi:HEPN domain-containing protein [Burkholderia cenocepacia]|uniref:ApeA N-terminal domain 1-containing protein n=1 Tax=Burkholderia cenocepacia TaxID=95486 RepID=UPI000D0BEF12|nr:HEPN domain-containing protein [Burkholderia cenocepacia]SOT38488.1 conserved hypothetical protein [Burkholderia cenocepacia]
MTKHQISEPTTFVGEWCLPSDEKNLQKIPGTLSWSIQRASLELHDSFNPLCGSVYGDETHSYPVIHGTTVQSQYVTLLKTLRTGNNLSFGPAGLRQPEKLVSSWVIVGAHVDDQTLYSEIRVRIPGLQMWLCRSGVEQTILHKTQGKAAGVVYRIDAMEEERHEISSLQTVLGWGIDRHFSGDLTTNISVITSACLRIQSEKPQPLDWFFEQLGKATTLLAFLAGSPMAPDQISAKVAEVDIEVDVLVALREAKYCIHKKISDFYMLRSSMEIDLGIVFSKWYEIYDTIAMPSQLALSVLSSEDLWLHIEFLSLMQALEGFHRATMTGLYTSEEAYESIKKTLSNSIPNTVGSDHKEALKSRIRYGNEISLRKRLDALISRLDLPLRKQILGNDGVVPRSWVVTRNYYTHWDNESRDHILDGVEMHRAGVRMRHLLRALYLDFVGIPQTAIAKALVNTCKESQYLIQLNNAEIRKRHPEEAIQPMMYIGVRDPESPDESQG